jgi:hypothetical protein
MISASDYRDPDDCERRIATCRTLQIGRVAAMVSDAILDRLKHWPSGRDDFRGQDGQNARFDTRFPVRPQEQRPWSFRPAGTIST